MLTRRWQEFDALGHLFLYGPKHSGKGQALKIFQRLVPKPLLFSTITTAGIYQAIDSLHPVMLMDECDRLGTGERSDYIEAMLQLLNVYERNEVAIRASREGSAIRIYDLFCLKILAGQNPLPGSLPDRCIRLDMEKSVKDVPIDVEIDERLRGQLEYYGIKHSEYKGLTKEQLKSLIGDNRLTQLYYPLYVSCPNPEGQKALIELAVEQLQERDRDEGYSELAEITERICDSVKNLTGKAVVAVVADVTGYKPWHVELSELTRHPFESMPKDQDVNRWLGWRLKKLQIRRERTGGLRYAVVDPRTLVKKVRRYAPYLLTTETTATTASQDRVVDERFENSEKHPRYLSALAETGRNVDKTTNSRRPPVYKDLCSSCWNRKYQSIGSATKTGQPLAGSCEDCGDIAGFRVRIL